MKTNTPLNKTARTTNVEDNGLTEPNNKLSQIGSQPTLRKGGNLVERQTSNVKSDRLETSLLGREDVFIPPHIVPSHPDETSPSSPSKQETSAFVDKGTTIKGPNILVTPIPGTEDFNPSPEPSLPTPTPLSGPTADGIINKEQVVKGPEILVTPIPETEPYDIEVVEGGGLAAVKSPNLSHLRRGGYIDKLITPIPGTELQQDFVSPGGRSNWTDRRTPSNSGQEASGTLTDGEDIQGPDILITPIPGTENQDVDAVNTGIAHPFTFGVSSIFLQQQGSGIVTDPEKKKKIDAFLKKNNIVGVTYFSIRVGKQIIRVIRTPDGFKKLKDPFKEIFINEGKPDAIRTGILDARDANLTPLTAEELKVVQQTLGKIPTFWDEYYATHPGDQIIIGLIYNFLGGDHDVQKVVAKLRKAGKGPQEILSDEEFEKKMNMAIFFVLFPAFLRKSKDGAKKLSKKTKQFVLDGFEQLRKKKGLKEGTTKALEEVSEQGLKIVNGALSENSVRALREASRNTVYLRYKEFLIEETNQLGKTISKKEFLTSEQKKQFVKETYKEFSEKVIELIKLDNPQYKNGFPKEAEDQILKILLHAFSDAIEATFPK